MFTLQNASRIFLNFYGCPLFFLLYSFFILSSAWISREYSIAAVPWVRSSSINSFFRATACSAVANVSGFIVRCRTRNGFALPSWYFVTPLGSCSRSTLLTDPFRLPMILLCGSCAVEQVNKGEKRDKRHEKTKAARGRLRRLSRLNAGYKHEKSLLESRPEMVEVAGLRYTLLK